MWRSVCCSCWMCVMIVVMYCYDEMCEWCVVIVMMWCVMWMIDESVCVWVDECEWLLMCVCNVSRVWIVNVVYVCCLCVVMWCECICDVCDDNVIEYKFVMCEVNVYNDDDMYMKCDWWLYWWVCEMCDVWWLNVCDVCDVYVLCVCVLLCAIMMCDDVWCVIECVFDVICMLWWMLIVCVIVDWVLYWNVISVVMNVIVCVCDEKCM